MIKNTLSRPIAELKGNDAGQPGSFSFQNVSNMASDMKKFFTVADEELRREQELYFDNVRKSEIKKDIYHKEILLVLIEATTKKKFGEQKMKDNTRKKIMREVKKEEKKAEAPAPKPAEVPKPKAEAPAPKAEAPKPKAEAPAPKAETAKKVETVSPATPSATPVSPAMSGAAKSAVKVGSSGLLAAAALSVKGETGATSLKNASTDIKKVGQIVPNDPKPGVSSYGIFGLNSGGSVQNFVKDNPQFNLSQYKPVTKEFDDAWKKNSKERTQEFYDAQIAWYDKYVYQPVKRDMQKKLPVELSSDDGVITYMADRRNQMGKLHEDTAIKYATPAKSPSDFIVKIAEHDFNDEYIRRAFPTYIKTHGEKNIKGLQRRVELRKEMSLNVSGKLINDMSTENKDIRKDMTQTPATVLLQQNNNVVSQPTTVISPKRPDNTNPVLR
jgi:hypothetical protein